MRRARRRQTGFTLLELLIVMMLVGLLVTAGVPSTSRVTEAANVDAGVVGLRSIWSAQRMYWLEHREYAATLRLLELDRLVNAELRLQSKPFEYLIESADGGSFVATATRSGSATWDGLLVVDQDGLVTGSVRDTGGTYVLTPSN